jgi:hypothetical protein
MTYGFQTSGSNGDSYGYDSIGNRIWSAENTLTNAYTVNNLNQYTSISNFVSFAPSCEIYPGGQKNAP